jgi:predicted amidohydrolase
MARYVRVSAISFSGAGGATEEERKENNIRAMCGLIEKACWDGPDLVITPEFFNVLGCERYVDLAETMDGETVGRLSELARRYKTWIACAMPERDGDKVYNSCILINRDGFPVGSYHKMHPTIGEMEQGITPGLESRPFQTDFGLIAFAICFDLNFRDVIESAMRDRSKGPRLICFPSMYRGGIQARIWAHDFGVWFASAITGPHSSIINPMGKVMAISEAYNPIVSSVVNLDYVVCHIDYNNAKFDEIKRKYGKGVELDVYSPEGRFILYSHMDGKSAEDIAEEFELETLESYFERANRVRMEALLR